MMNMSKLLNIFKNEHPAHSPKETQALAQLKQYAKEQNFPIFEETPIYYRSQEMVVPFAIFIPHCGLILFERKGWSFEELQGASVSKTSHVKSASTTLSFENISDFIKEKFMDLSGFDTLEIYNFVILDNLTLEEYKQLDETFHQLIPLSRIVFKSTTQEDIAQLFGSLQNLSREYTVDNTLPYIFSQYLIPSEDGVFFASCEQREFLDSELEKRGNLFGQRQSGKTTLLLQKAILEHKRNPKKVIHILTASNLQADLLKSKLLEIVEASSIVIDMEKIVFFSVLSLVDRFEKQDKTALKEATMGERIFVDDAHTIPKHHLDSLKQITKKRTLFTINDPQGESKFVLRKHYYAPWELFQTQEEFSSMLKKLFSVYDEDKQTVMIVSKNVHDKAFDEDIENFTGVQTQTVDTNGSLVDIDQKKLLLSSYKVQNPLCCDYVFLIDPCQSDRDSFIHFAQAAKKKCYVFYQQSCDNIEELRKMKKEEVSR